MKYSSPSLLDGSVTTAKLATSSVTGPKIAGSAVTASKIAPTAVATAKLSVAAVTRLRLDTAEVSMSGTITAASRIDIELLAFAFWPMIHVQDATEVTLSGHETDAPGADNPRLSLNNTVGSSRTWDLDYRHVVD